MIAADEAALRTLIADDALLFHGSGAVEEKAAFVAGMFQRLEIASVSRENARVREIAPGVAIASCVQEQRLRPRGGDAAYKRARANVSRVWVKRDGRWRMANYHAVRLPDQP